MSVCATVCIKLLGVSSIYLTESDTGIEHMLSNY